MSDIDVRPQALRDAAEAAREAAERAGKVSIGDAIGRVAAAMPGTDSADAARKLGPLWSRVVRSWSDDMDFRATALVSSADRLDADEDASAADFNRMMPRVTRDGPI